MHETTTESTPTVHAGGRMPFEDPGQEHKQFSSVARAISVCKGASGHQQTRNRLNCAIHVFRFDVELDPVGLRAKSQRVFAGSHRTLAVTPSIVIRRKHHTCGSTAAAQPSFGFVTCRVPKIAKTLGKPCTTPNTLCRSFTPHFGPEHTGLHHSGRITEKPLKAASVVLPPGVLLTLGVSKTCSHLGENTIRLAIESTGWIPSTKSRGNSPCSHDEPWASPLAQHLFSEPVGSPPWPQPSQRQDLRGPPRCAPALAERESPGRNGNPGSRPMPPPLAPMQATRPPEADHHNR